MGVTCIYYKTVHVNKIIAVSLVKPLSFIYVQLTTVQQVGITHLLTVGQAANAVWAKVNSQGLQICKFGQSQHSNDRFPNPQSKSILKIVEKS